MTDNFQHKKTKHSTNFVVSCIHDFEMTDWFSHADIALEKLYSIDNVNIDNVRVSCSSVFSAR